VGFEGGFFLLFFILPSFLYQDPIRPGCSFWIPLHVLGLRPVQPRCGICAIGLQLLPQTWLRLAALTKADGRTTACRTTSAQAMYVAA